MAKNCEIPNGELSEFDLPRVCVMTGSMETIEFRPVKFAWYPRWVGSLVIIAWPLALIMMQVMTKRVSGKLPFSTPGWERYQRGKKMSIAAVLSFFVGLMVCVAAGAADLPALIFVGLALALIVPLVLVIGFTRNTRINVTKITESHITLKLPSNEASDAFSAHLQGGGVRAAVPLPVQ